MGASRGRLVAEHLVESGVLAAAGSVVGVLVAPPVVRAMLPFLPSVGASGLGLSPELDARVLVVALGVAVVVTLISGAAPALYAGTVAPVNALKAHAAGITGALGLRRVLVISQFALALVLLVGAGLAARKVGRISPLVVLRVD